MIINCRISGCESKIETNEPTIENATYLCAKHPRSVQVESVGRRYDPIRDEADSELAFQTCQFDPEFARPYSGRVNESGEFEEGIIAPPLDHLS